MNSNGEKYFAKEFIELTIRSIDYIMKNVDKIAKLPHKELEPLNQRDLLYELIKTYKSKPITDGDLGSQLIAFATLIKKIIEDKKYITPKETFEFFEHGGKYYLKE